MIRIAVPSDIPFLLETAKAAYASTGMSFDVALARSWAERALSDPNTLVLRGERGGAVASVVHPFWREKPMALLVFAYALPSRGMVGEGIRLIRRLDEWRREMGASDFHFGDDTGMDFGPIAKRLGAKLGRPTYVLSGGESARESSVREGAEPQVTLLERMLQSGPRDPRPFLKVIGQ